MSFMKPETTGRINWYVIDGHMGTEYIPEDVCGIISVEDIIEANLTDVIPEALRDYCQNTRCWTLEVIKGYGVRLSASGYMDCTEWTVYATEAEANKAVDELEEEEAEEEDEEE